MTINEEITNTFQQSVRLYNMLVLIYTVIMLLKVFYI